MDVKKIMNATNSFVYQYWFTDNIVGPKIDIKDVKDVKYVKDVKDVK